MKIEEPLMQTKRLRVIVYALVATVIMSLTVFFAFSYLVSINEYIGLILGATLMVFAIPIHLFAKEQPFLYYLSFLFNITGVALVMTAYYVFKQYPLGLEDYLIASGVSLVFLTGFAFLSKMTWFRHHSKLYTGLIILVSFVVSLVLWLSIPGFSGLTFYYLNVFYFFMLAIIADSPDKDAVNKEMSLVSFGAFILVSIIVLVFITEGEVLSNLGDGIDFSPTGRRKKR